MGPCPQHAGDGLFFAVAARGHGDTVVPDSGANADGVPTCVVHVAGRWGGIWPEWRSGHQGLAWPSSPGEVGTWTLGTSRVGCLSWRGWEWAMLGDSREGPADVGQRLGSGSG